MTKRKLNFNNTPPIEAPAPTTREASSILAAELRQEQNLAQGGFNNEKTIGKISSPKKAKELPSDFLYAVEQATPASQKYKTKKHNKNDIYIKTAKKPAEEDGCLDRIFLFDEELGANNKRENIFTVNDDEFTDTDSEPMGDFYPEPTT